MKKQLRKYTWNKLLRYFLNFSSVLKQHSDELPFLVHLDELIEKPGSGNINISIQLMCLFHDLKQRHPMVLAVSYTKTEYGVL